MAKKEIIRIRFNSDPRMVIDNHMSDSIFLLDVDFRDFKDINNAVKFFTECTSPITKIEEIIPELTDQDIKMPWILPESHIRPKHVLLDKMENFTNLDYRYTWK